MGFSKADGRDTRHIDGDLAEAIALAHFTRKGYWCFPSLHASSPIDLVAIKDAETLFLQIKKDAKRQNKGRSKKERIYRARSALQKRLNVTMCYVNLKTCEVLVTDHRYHKKRIEKAHQREGREKSAD
tara:strand:+ start:465 stop:848 length:384 start_codon:yes stop_codon:yes gene_type:complete